MIARSSIAVRLPIVAGGLALLLAGTLSWASYREVRKTTVDVATQRLGNLADELTTQLGNLVRAYTRQLQGWSQAPDVAGWLRQPGPATERRARQLLSELSAGDTALGAWRLTASSGDTIVVGTIPAAPGAPPADSVSVGPIAVVGDTTWFAFSVPTAASGRIELWRRMNPTPATRNQMPSLGGVGTTFLIGSEPGAWTDLMTPAPRPPVDLSRDTSFTVVENDSAGRHYAIVRRAAGTPWYVVVRRPQAPILAPATAFLERILVIGVGLGVFALALAWWQGRRIAAPLREFTAATRAMSGADYTQRVTVAGADELAQLAVTFNTMAERVQDEVAARRRSEDQWRDLFAANPLPMWVIDEESFRFLAVNEAAIRHYGYSEAEFLSMTLEDIRPPDTVPRMRQELGKAAGKPALASAWVHRRKDGSLINVEVTSNALTFAGRKARLALAQDVTMRKALEAELRQAQKMEAVGRLAAGVAHDFNNVLAVILTHADLLREDLRSNTEAAEELDEIIKAGQHAHTLTRQLLAFSRQQVVRPEILDLNTVIGRLERLVRPVVGSNVTMVIQLDPSAGSVEADPAQIEQILLNLVMNARDAMPRGGTLTVATGSAEREGRPFVTLAVRDTGIGMDDEVKSRVFEPFFTTKGEGKGTGLGLASVYGIAAQSGGTVTVESTPRKGSSFVVWLPRAEAAGPATGPTAPAGAPLRGTETVLLAEDEPAVRAVVAGILKRYGYTVLVAEDGKQALEMAASAGRIDLLLTDVVMPGLTGPALLETLRETRPGLRGLFMSGYAGDAIREHGLKDTSIPFIEKPFSVTALAEKVREALK